MVGGAGKSGRKENCVWSGCIVLEKNLLSIKKKNDNFLFMCICVCLCECLVTCMWVPAVTRREHQILWRRNYRWLCFALSACWELNSGLLVEH